MTKTNDQGNIHVDGHESNTSSSGVVIVQQQPITDQQQQHFVLSSVNNSAPMIITTPLGEITRLESFFLNFSVQLFHPLSLNNYQRHQRILNNKQQQS